MISRRDEQMITNELISSLKGGLIVSCQALEHEPLYSSYMMSKMALAAKLGGAVGIRANSYSDIVAIKKEVNLPVIGIVKKDYEDSEIYITPTLTEVDEVMDTGAEIIALDATKRLRPNGKSLEEFYSGIKAKYPKVLLMADISTFEEGIRAREIGFDLVATTLSGYTEETKHVLLPNLSLLERLTKELDIPVMAEGGYWESTDLKRALNYGAHACIVGSAITRPLEITRRFVNSMNEK
jgi:N-acylglucosamine-6-phosphate 2-epimerase